MPNVDELVSLLPPGHQIALAWFHTRAGTVVPWPSPLPDGTLLATRAKGIYKPEWSAYALSIRQTLDSPYPEEAPPRYREDGTWCYTYYPEGLTGSTQPVFTNEALVRCAESHVPVGVMRQVQKRPAMYTVHGIALVAAWGQGYFILEGFAPNGSAHGPVTAAEARGLLADQDIPGFDPQGVADARERVLTLLVRRRGQQQFRNQLIQAYASRCAITECDALPTLEAAHIVPYLGPTTNHPSNGLLLRADLHSLFDLGLIAIEPTNMHVVVDSTLATTQYATLVGKNLQMPLDPSLRPSPIALAQHKSWAGL